MTMKKIALLGAGSHLGKGLISEFARLRFDDFNCMGLYARDPDTVCAWIKSELKLKKQVYPTDSFGTEQFDIVINAIGVSDTTQILEMGSQAFEINRQYDERVMSYLDSFPASKYIYISSGAVYGGEFQDPATNKSLARVNLNAPSQIDWYGLAKLSSEIRHRSKPSFAIVDVRVYGYMSPWLPLDKPFLLADIAKALIHQIPLRTDRRDFWRDYIGPSELACVVFAVMDSPPHNTSIDVYSAAPILKTEMLEVLTRQFSLMIDFISDAPINTAATYKFNYFTKDKRAADFGFSPGRASERVIVEELCSLLAASKSQLGGTL
jgi:nucleoside-diphosphate-sugar epimerase